MVWLDLEDEIRLLFTPKLPTGNRITKLDRLSLIRQQLEEQFRTLQCAMCERVYNIEASGRRRSPRAMTCSDKCHLIRQQAKHAPIVNPYTPRPDKRRMVHEKMRASMVAFSIERTCNQCKRGNAMKSVGCGVLQCKWCNSIR